MKITPEEFEKILPSEKEVNSGYDFPNNEFGDASNRGWNACLKQIKDNYNRIKE